MGTVSGGEVLTEEAGPTLEEGAGPCDMGRGGMCRMTPTHLAQGSQLGS